VANALARYGVAAFVAHDAIRATKQWEREIVRALRTCDALCAVLTADFSESLWCDQEVGFVLGRGQLVIPLRVDTNPYGFIGGVQGVPVRPRALVLEVVDSLLDALLTSDLTSQSISPVIVRRYARSGDGDAARAGLAMIKRIRREAWTPEMVEEVARAATENIQIREAALDGRPLPEISSQLLADLALRPVPTAPADDDIPF
jgi:hypothetical protein